ncbi:MAG TPA: PQQ-binding-like beta-propeller repeat protein [Aggregatilineales bacterium]|nr:PQQ-binding-like beta-propeller repeat protein [Aggregatilineales bacterium]
MNGLYIGGFTLTSHKIPRFVCIVGLILLLTPTAAIPALSDGGSNADWPMWGYDLANHRYNPGEMMLTPANVGKLQRKWTFAFPNTGIASTTPTVVGDTVYVGSWNGHVYALDTTTGTQRWDFNTSMTGKGAAVRVGIVVAHDLVMFGDQAGRFYALNRATGVPAWLPQTLDNHPLAQITGSPVVYGDRVYVPMSSREESAAADFNYACCTFRGSLTALNISDGSVAWRFYTVDEPEPTEKSSTGIQHSAPSGAAIWSTPSIDPESGLIYLTTGNGYSNPAASNTDAILAISLADGTLRWSKQVTPGDWANDGCLLNPPGPNCAGTHGKDLDFGASPLLYMIQTANGPHKIVAAEQKSGTLYALDALTGEQVWQRGVGLPTSYAWGMSYDGQRLYVSDNTFQVNGGVYALDPASGKVLWHSGPMQCTPGAKQIAAECWSGFMAAAISTPGLVWMGSMDGQVRALDSATGRILWHANTTGDIMGVNGQKGHGGSIGPSNVTVANGQLFVTSGYAAWTSRMLEGNVLVVYGLSQGQLF